ncbi:hypothetical protein SAMN05421504_12219 [Amycolatopsis xylanica]|uniref:Pyridoxamine 5'-phosphate oxidase N-terminal domain-containing protein n=1 Tax=Amycolatopsis xylanica TaxID=589385 RepID=A0A1H3TBK0_9PSEU|nr:pyridoxamine 5'-phosphate oxidase family protein [Amycolatopsis xylanica]SDZ47480.1 hypothetical protein SAMN05421504_12219 [Amycolatopsis xylanica]
MGTVTVVDTHEALTGIIGEVGEGAIRKDIGRIDPHARTLIENSPFVLLATSAPDGTCDVSPRGDPAGSVLVLDEKTLVIADRPGNHRVDNFRNIIDNPHVGLLFLVPGMNETLRVNGSAQLVSDGPFFDDLIVKDKRPQLAIVVTVDELYLHCAKAFLRSSLWKPETWPDRKSLPSAGRIFKDQLNIAADAEAIDADLTARSIAHQY